MRLALIIAVLCSLAGVAQAAPASEPHKAYLTLIIDDLGQNLPWLVVCSRYPAR